MSHDTALSQPLFAIWSFAQACLVTLQSGTEGRTEHLVELATQISQQAERTGHIVKSLQSFTRKAEPLSATDLNVLIRDMASLFELEARRYQVTVQYELAESLSKVLAEQNLIEQVMLNLVRNAVDAMQESMAGQRQLVIRTAEREPRFVEVAIQDTGRGIPDSHVDRLFHRFFTTKPDGLGLGLAISQKIIEGQGGRIWVTPNANQGVTFRFTLPIASNEGT